MTKEQLLSPETGALRKRLVIFTGPTASGKDTVMDLFLQHHPNFGRIVPCTTRPAHANEVDGRDYHFLSKSEFQQARPHLCAILERKMNGGIAYYGTSINQVCQVLEGQPKIWKLDPETACDLRPNLVGFFSKSELDSLLERTAIIYLGVERLTMLRDRLRKRARPDDVPNVFLPRLRQEWDCWQRIKHKVDPFICDLSSVSEEELLARLEARLRFREKSLKI